MKSRSAESRRSRVGHPAGNIAATGIVPVVVAAAMVLIVAGALCFASCRAPENASGAGNARDSGGEIPRPEDAVMMPALSRGDTELLIAFRHTRCGFLEEMGFDTYVYRFRILPSGRIDGAARYERKLGGEREIASWTFARAGDAVIAGERLSGGETYSYTLGFSGEKAEIGGAARRVITLGKDILRVGSPGGEYLEEYGIDVDRGFSAYRNGRLETRGSFGFPAKGRMIFLRGGEGESSGLPPIEINLWSDRDGSLRARAEGPEPVGEVYVGGLKRVLAEGPVLENFALIDLVVAADERDALRPILASAISGKVFAD